MGKKLETKPKLTGRFIEERQFPGYALHRITLSRMGRQAESTTEAMSVSDRGIGPEMERLPRSTPMSSDRLNAPSFDIWTGAGSLVEARFIPQRYEPNYPYPLLAL